MYDVKANNVKTPDWLYSGTERREHPREPEDAYERFLWWQCKNERERYPTC